MSKKIRLGYDILSKRAIESESGVNIDEALRSISSYQKVPGVGIDNHPDVPRPSTKVLYIVKVASAGQPDTYKEWIWTQPSDGLGYWECTGDTTQDLSGYALKSEMSVEPGTGADADKTTITLKEGTSATVLTAHQDISGYALKSDMSVEPGTGMDADKTTITLKEGTSATVLTAHQDLSGKADKVSGGTAGHFASLDSNGNLVDSTYAPGSFKEKGSHATYTNDSGTKTVDAVEQDADGNVTVTYKEIQAASTSGSGLVQLEDSHTSTSTTTAATPKNVKEAYDLASGKYSLPSGGIPDTDLSSAIQASLGKADSAIQHVYAGSDELVPDNTKAVTIPYAENGNIPSHTAVIGGRTYRTVTMPDGKEWMAENLDFKFSGLVIGQGSSSSEPRANYYNNDETTYGVNGNKYGLLYNWIAVKYLEDNKSELITGWHVPTTSEWDALATAVGGSGVAGTKLKSTTGWSSGNGDGSYGFAAFPAGGQDSGSFISLGSNALFWTATEYSSYYAYFRYFDTGASMSSNDYDKYCGFSVRLAKDTPLEPASPSKGGLMTASMVEKLEGIEAHAQVNVQADWNVSDNTSDAFIKNKPSLATVATSGNYTDLSNKPTIPVVPESTTATIDSTTYLRTYGGNGVYAMRADCDKEGNDITLGIDGTTNTVTDNSGEPVQDSSGNPLVDAESDARVVSIGELPIWADRAEKDASGNDIETTYATKQELQDALGDLETILASI